MPVNHVSALDVLLGLRFLTLAPWQVQCFDAWQRVLLGNLFQSAWSFHLEAARICRCAAWSQIDSFVFVSATLKGISCISFLSTSNRSLHYECMCVLKYIRSMIWCMFVWLVCSIHKPKYKCPQCATHPLIMPLMEWADLLVVVLFTCTVIEASRTQSE